MVAMVTYCLQASFESDHVMPMEYLPLNEGSGQGYGYVLYRTKIPSNSKKVSISSLHDHGVVSGRGKWVWY